MNPNTRGIIAASVTALLWGFLAIAMKVTLGYIGSVAIIWFRFTLAASILLIYHLIYRAKPLKNILKSFPISLFIAALLLGGNYLGFVVGLDYTTPSTTQVIIQMGPIFLAISGIVFFKEKVNTLQLFGFGVAGLGLTLFYFNQLGEFTSASTYNKGFFWILGAAISWTIYAILQKKLVAKYEPQLMNLFIYGIPALALTPFVDFSEFQGLVTWQWVLLVFLGLNTLIAYGSLILAFKYTQAYKVSIIITLNPIITLITMTLLFYMEVCWISGEKLSLFSTLGALLLIGGAILAVFFSRKNK